MAIDTKRLRELANAATPGPWRAERDGSNHRGKVWENSERGVEMIGTMYCGAFDGHGFRNAEYVAAANPTTVLALLDRIDALESAQKQPPFYREMWLALVTECQVANQPDHQQAALKCICDLRARLATVTAARDRIYEIAKGTFALHLMTPELAAEMDHLRTAGSKGTK